MFQIKFPASLSFMFFFEFEHYLLSTREIPVGGGGGTPIHGLDRYVPPDRGGGVMEGLYPKNRVSFLPLLARVVFLV